MNDPKREEKRARKQFAYFRILVEPALNRVVPTLHYHMLSRENLVPPASGKKEKPRAERKCKRLGPTRVQSEVKSRERSSSCSKVQLMCCMH